MNGGDQGTKKNLDMICKVLGKDKVDIYYLHQKAGKSKLIEYIKGALFIPFGYFFGLTPTKVKDIVCTAKKYDYVFIDRSIFGIVARELKRANYIGKIITSFQNVEVHYMDAKISKHTPLRNVLINCADKNDKWSCTYSDKVIVLNERDRYEIQKRYKRIAEITIPVTLEDQLSYKPNLTKLTGNCPKCLSIGAYFTPNNEGILWFVKNVLPHVNVEYKIVGKGMERLKRDYPEELKDIEVISDVPSLTPYFEEAEIMILPIFSGSGMKVKTCESLMYGKNIIATDEALQGYDIVEGISAWRSNTPEEFICCIKDFIQYPKPYFNKEARTCFLENYSNQSVERKFKELLS